MTIGEDIKSDEIFDKLLHTDYSFVDYFGNDQKSINLTFGKSIIELPHKYNVLITESDCIDEKEVVFWHYIHKPHFYKQHEEAYGKWFSMWDEYGIGRRRRG
jgi:lipopolysaccharide biosynthesis glycosyltransferase